MRSDVSSLFEKWSTIRERFTKAAHLALSAKNTFGNFSLATDHGRIHTGERILCPYAEEDSCSKLFMRKADLKKHVEGDHDRRRYQCPFAKDVNCTRTFGRADSARSHAKSSHGRGWLCTVPLCRMAVSRVPVRRVAIRKHMLAHKAKGHLEGLEERPEPIRVPFKALLRDQTYVFYHAKNASDLCHSSLLGKSHIAQHQYY